MDIYVYMYVYTYTNVHVCIYIYVYMYVNTYIPVRTQELPLASRAPVIFYFFGNVTDIRQITFRIDV